MIVYFGFTVAGDRSSVESARQIVALLERMGHRVLTRHLVEDHAWEADGRMPAQDVYERDMRWLEECDIFIAEVSGSSFGLGYEAGYVLARYKKAILFYRADAAGRISRMITGNTHPNCVLAPYTDCAEVEKALQMHLPQTEEG